MTPKTYETLRAEAATRWAALTQGHQMKMQTLRDQVAQSPDVVHAPIPGSVWDNELILCRKCGGHVYEMRRYACINGRKYRTEIRCIACNQMNTWNFETHQWLA